MCNEYSDFVIRLEEKLDGILSLLASTMTCPERELCVGGPQLSRTQPARSQSFSPRSSRLQPFRPLWPVRFPRYRPRLGDALVPISNIHEHLTRTPLVPGTVGVLHWGMLH